jgi:uncharacterized protein
MLSIFLRLFGVLSVLSGFLYVGLGATLWYKQRDFLFNSKNQSIDFQSLGFENTELHWIKSTDNTVLESFYHPAPPNRPVVLYFHGKGTEISNEAKSLKVLAARDFGFLAISYRGFGKSVGQPTEEGLIADAVVAYDWLRNRGVNEKQIMVLGLSLGSGVAVQLAAKKSLAAVALGAPYTSTAEVAAERYWYLPVHYLMIDQFKSSEFIRSVSEPLFILHGETDKTVSVRYGKKLFELANEPKKIILVRGQGHPLIFQEQSMRLYADFFDSVLAKNQVEH